ncbi:MAG: hypothetical protein D6701_00445 [Gemmatimonadetes bacterium]|nr:MAG: hypothetical protein D6701_00445 [Gemmatimonadota bacterium]
MTAPSVHEEKAKRELAQLLRLHARILDQLETVRAELDAPTTKALVQELRTRFGSSATLSVQDVTKAVEEAIRAVMLSESRLQNEVLEDAELASVEGVSNLPATLARFLAERSELPGFSYEVIQDEVRGWVIRWKEHTETGGVRGFGQFYERPFAWLEE